MNKRCGAAGGIALFTLGVCAVACEGDSEPASPEATDNDNTAEGSPATQGQVTTKRLGMFPEPLKDQEVTSAISREFVFDPAVPSADLDVTTTAGIVQLTGSVPNLLAKERAVLITEAVKGVRSVIDRIDVRPKAVADSQLRKTINEALINDPTTDSYEIRVEVDSGIVTLTGSVDSWAEKDLAERVAKQVPGVVDVSNEITLDYPSERSDYEIARDVEARLRWDALVDHGLVKVSVDDGRVKLSGTVGSAAERRRAEVDAWVVGVDGVDSDGLDVEWWARDGDIRKQRFPQVSDDAIAKAIKSAAIYDPRVSSFEFTADVNNGAVTLRGSVDSLKERAALEHLAKHTVGVASVTNLVIVAPDPLIGDPVLESEVLAGLARNVLTEPSEIEVNVQDGVATLRGKVDTFAEKAEAGDVAGTVVGIKKVINELEVTTSGGAFFYDPYVYPYHPYLDTWSAYTWAKPEKADAEIAHQIRDQLFWSPFVDAGDISIKVENGKATLSGTADSWQERNAAIENAYEGGALIVEDKIAVK